MSLPRTYRGATLNRRFRDKEPHGFWLMPDGPVADHPDRGWVRTLEEARAEVDRHIDGGGCLMREGGRWLGVLAGSRVDSMYERTLRGFSAWCAARADERHDPCSTRGCPCACHGRDS